MVDTLTLETGQNVLLNVGEELRQDLEPVQTLLLQTEELTVSETVLKPKIVTHKDVQVKHENKQFLSIIYFSKFRNLTSSDWKHPSFIISSVYREKSNSITWCS